MAKKSDMKKWLLDQLDAKGARNPIFEELVETYMTLYDEEKMLHKDIKENGLRIKRLASNGKEYDEPNPSVQKADSKNKRRVDILRQLGISAENCAAGEEDEL